MSGFNKTMKLKTFFLLLLVVITSVTAQDYKWGFSASANRISANEKWSVSFAYPPPFKIVQYEREMNYMGYGLYYCGVWQLDSQNEILLKPGIFLSDEIFSGLEAGLYYKRILLNDFKVSFGFNVNLHDFFEWANGRPLNTTIDVALERRLIDDVFIGASFAKPVNENFGNSYQWEINGEHINNGLSVIKVHYMLKAYVEIYF